MVVRILCTMITAAMALPANNITTLMPENETTAEAITKVVGPSQSPPLELVPDIVITLAVIGTCAGIGIGIAKCADIVYDRHIAKFSKKEINDNTRKLLRARVAIIRMKPDPKVPELKVVKRVASMWMSKTAGKKEMADPKNSNVTNEIGTTHVPGIQVDRSEAEERKTYDAFKTREVKHETSTIAQLASVPQTDTIVRFTETEKDPIEQTISRMKIGGRLPPVVVHDIPKS